MIRAPPKIPQVHIPEEPVLQIASALRIEINRAFAVLRDIASGRDLKKFLSVCWFPFVVVLLLFVAFVAPSTWWWLNEGRGDLLAHLRLFLLQLISFLYIYVGYMVWWPVEYPGNFYWWTEAGEHIVCLAMLQIIVPISNLLAGIKCGFCFVLIRWLLDYGFSLLLGVGPTSWHCSI